MIDRPQSHDVHHCPQDGDPEPIPRLPDPEERYHRLFSWARWLYRQSEAADVVILSGQFARSLAFVALAAAREERQRLEAASAAQRRRSWLGPAA